MIRLFGFNRRQKPVELRCPGGRLVVSREPHGTVLVRFIGDGGRIEVEPGGREWQAQVRIKHEDA